MTNGFFPNQGLRPLTLDGGRTPVEIRDGHLRSSMRQHLYMNLREWDEHYQSATPDLSPSPLLVEAVKAIAPGRALDLACGLGRNALYLAQLGWEVTAVDGSGQAIARLNKEATRRGLTLKARAADLEAGEFAIETEKWDLIVCCLYFQRDLLAGIKRGLKTGGLYVASALLADESKAGSPFRVQPGELPSSLSGWQILQSAEKREAKHATPELVARKQ